MEKRLFWDPLCDAGASAKLSAVTSGKRRVQLFKAEGVDTPTVCAHTLKIAAFSIKTAMHGIDGGQKEAAFAPPGQVAHGEMEGLHPCPRPSLTQQRRRSGRWRRWGLRWRCCSRTFSSSRWECLLRCLTSLFSFLFFVFFCPAA